VPENAERDHSFGSGEPFSLGVEEELFLVDPVTGRQTNSSTAVLERLGELDGKVERELHACQVELISKVHAAAGEAVRELGELRRALTKTGAGILASGTHPSAAEGDALITDRSVTSAFDSCSAMRS
jgi:carboxylate-amine ligase